MFFLCLLTDYYFTFDWISNCLSMSCEDVSSFGDNALIILRSLLDFCSKKDYNKRLSFLLRCLIGGLFDFLEYGILLYDRSIENSTTNYVFYVICLIYGLYLIVLSICFCLSKDIHTIGSHLLFKCISLTMAIMLFGTITDFDYLFHCWF